MALKAHILIYFIVVLLYSCKEHSNKEIITSYGYYSNNKCIREDSFQIKRQQILHSDTFNVQIYLGNVLTGGYKEYIDPIKGIFRFCINNYYLTYSFDKIEAIEINCMKQNLFQSTIIEKKQSKVYKINEITYEINAFVEYSPVYGTIVSYYNSSYGFICHYKGESDSYFLIDNLNDEQIDKKTLKGLENKLIHDTTYFGYFVSKQIPHYPPPSLLK